MGNAGCCLLVCMALLTGACRVFEERVPPHAGLDAMWRQYMKLPPQRALAIAGDPNGHWVGAAAGGADKQADASDRALAECRRKRSARRMRVPCLIYAAGDAIIWPAP